LVSPAWGSRTGVRRRPRAWPPMASRVVGAGACDAVADKQAGGVQEPVAKPLSEPRAAAGVAAVPASSTLVAACAFLCRRGPLHLAPSKSTLASGRPGRCSGLLRESQVAHRGEQVTKPCHVIPPSGMGRPYARLTAKVQAVGAPFRLPSSTRARPLPPGHRTRSGLGAMGRDHFQPQDDHRGHSDTQARRLDAAAGVRGLTRDEVVPGGPLALRRRRPTQGHARPEFGGHRAPPPDVSRDGRGSVSVGSPEAEEVERGATYPMPYRQAPVAHQGTRRQVDLCLPSLREGARQAATATNERRRGTGRRRHGPDRRRRAMKASHRSVRTDAHSEAGQATCL
jgi:hypothetical protein